MRVARLEGLRTIRVSEASVPEIEGPRDVLVRMKAVGVCGSDLHYYRTGRIGSQVVTFPYAIGHEGAGVVERTGPGVARLRPGDRVAIEPAISCGDCDQCLAGRPHTCRRARFLGCPGQIEGCLADFIVMPEDGCLPIPDAMSFEQAALVEPLAIGLYAARLAGDLRGRRLAILGAGPIGLSVLLAAREAGADRICVTEPLAARRAAAAGAGADAVVDPVSVDAVSEILKREPLQLDTVIECCGKQEAIDQAFELLKPGGTLLIVGIPEFDRFSFPADLGRRKEIRILNVRRQNHCTPDAIDRVASGRIRADFMITHRFQLPCVADAFALVDRYGDGVIKAMIEIG